MPAGMKLLGAVALTDWFVDSMNLWGNEIEWIVGSNVHYAPHQEFGTSVQDGTPHLRPAADKTEAKMAEFALAADDAEEFVKMAALYLESETKILSPVDTGRLRSSYAAIRTK